jgi:hypothetical protein
VAYTAGPVTAKGADRVGPAAKRTASVVNSITKPPPGWESASEVKAATPSRSRTAHGQAPCASDKTAAGTNEVASAAVTRT